MKKILIAALALMAVTSAWFAGKSSGINHALESMELCIVDAVCTNFQEENDTQKRSYRFDAYTDPTGMDFDGKIYIDLDGNYYEKGFYIG